jgi:hypothetical protein
MKRRLTTREKVLLGLLAVAAILSYRMLTDEAILSGGQAGADEADRDLGVAPQVRMDLLERQAATFDSEGRNLFAYYVPPPPPPRYTVPPPPQALPPPPVRTAPAPPPTPPPPVAPQAPQPSFHYLGFLGPKDARIAVFDAGEEPTHARIGDTIETHFRLLEFKHDSVILGYTDEQWQGRTTELKLAGLR